MGKTAICATHHKFTNLGGSAIACHDPVRNWVLYERYGRRGMWYGFRMDGKVIEFDHMHQVEALRRHLTDAECRRLGFIFDDEVGVTMLSAAGFGFLIYLAYQGPQSVAEAFAAGYQCAAESYDPALDPSLGRTTTSEENL